MSVIMGRRLGMEKCKELKCECCPLEKYCNKVFSTPNQHFEEIYEKYKNVDKKLEIMEISIDSIRFLLEKEDIQKELNSISPLRKDILNVQGFIGPVSDDYQAYLDNEFKKFIEEHSQDDEKKVGFVEYLYSLMDKYGYDNAADLYNLAGISRQLWSSIISGKSHPSLNVCIKLAFAMHLTNHECKYLLKKAGFTLASSSKYALIIRFALEYEIYHLDFVNDLLEKNGYSDSLIY